MAEGVKLPPLEKRGGYSPQSSAPSPSKAPPKPTDAGQSAQPKSSNGNG
jgi:hypothetical protein